MSGDPKYEVLLLPVAVKDLAKLPSTVRRAIGARIDDLSNDPRPVASKKLKGMPNTYRLRVGVHRVLYRIDARQVTITVVKIGPRKDVYRLD